MGILGGLAFSLVGMFQSASLPDTQVEIQRKALHDRVQKVRDALQTTQDVPADLGVRSRLAQWYNWNNWPNGWSNYWNNWSNRWWNG